MSYPGGDVALDQLRNGIILLLNGLCGLCKKTRKVQIEGALIYRKTTCFKLKNSQNMKQNLDLKGNKVSM